MAMNIGAINIYGLNFPHLEFVLSTIIPIIRSVTASNILATRNSTPTETAHIPK